MTQNDVCVSIYVNFADTEHKYCTALATIERYTALLDTAFHSEYLHTYREKRPASFAKMLTVFIKQSALQTQSACMYVPGRI